MVQCVIKFDFKFIISKVRKRKEKQTKKGIFMKFIYLLLIFTLFPMSLAYAYGDKEEGEKLKLLSIQELQKIKIPTPLLEEYSFCGVFPHSPNSKLFCYKNSASPLSLTLKHLKDSSDSISSHFHLLKEKLRLKFEDENTLKKYFEALTEKLKDLDYEVLENQLQNTHTKNSSIFSPNAYLFALKYSFGSTFVVGGDVDFLLGLVVVPQEVSQINREDYKTERTEETFDFIFVLIPSVSTGLGLRVGGSTAGLVIGIINDRNEPPLVNAEEVSGGVQLGGNLKLNAFLGLNSTVSGIWKNIQFEPRFFLSLLSLEKGMKLGGGAYIKIGAILKISDIVPLTENAIEKAKDWIER